MDQQRLNAESGFLKHRIMQSVPRCSCCGESMSEDQLGGRHLCRIQVKYRCPKCGNGWNSWRGRFDPQANHVYRQCCARTACKGQLGTVERWRPLSRDAWKQGPESDDAAKQPQSFCAST